jgi:carboxymethylenebutenolidase
MTTQTISPLNPNQQTMLSTLQQHMMAEMTGDLMTTMKTMTANPHVYHVPVMTGGAGANEVRHFYKNHLVGKFMPPDTEITTLARVIDEHYIVEEGIARFTHSMMLDWLLPGIPPTGKTIELAVVVIIKFEDGKIAHEHIYWDQASVLVQIGLLDPAGLPVNGAESVQRLRALAGQ